MLLHARIRDFRLVAVVDAAGSVRTQVQALVLVRVDDLAALQLLAYQIANNAIDFVQRQGVIHPAHLCEHRG